jgi:antagonist of KipI
MSCIEVLSPGLQTTVQDLGRLGYGALGVSAAGAADPTALRIANRLVGNPEGAAGLEMTLQGGQFLFPEGAVVALAGSDFEVPLWQSFEVGAGEVLRVGRSMSGARCYLAVRGGIRVPLVLGSASTHVAIGLGGFEGRALRRGDRLDIGQTAGEFIARQVPGPEPRSVLRATEGPQRDWFDDAVLYSSAYTVTADANRMGIRLHGSPIIPICQSELVSEGVSLGCIQVPAGGQPVILFVEQQTTGGYAKIANVIAADLPALGQLKPGDAIRFQRVDLREARELLYIQERWIRSI